MMILQKLSALTLTKRTQKRRSGNTSGTDRIYSDVLSRVLDSRRASEVDHTGLGSVVGTQHIVCGEPRDGGGVDDCASALSHHLGNRVSHAVKDAGKRNSDRTL